MPPILAAVKAGGTVGEISDVLRSVFGERRVYLEYGDEPDLAGVDAASYTAGWNQVIPELKRIAPAAYQFVGPPHSRPIRPTRRPS